MTAATALTGQQLNDLLKTDRVEWTKQMRLFVSPPGMIDEAGVVKQDYFKPKRVVYMGEEKKWGPEQKDLLYQGIEKHGIGYYDLIRQEFLPAWEVGALRIKAARLMGRQDLSSYKAAGWKGNREAVEAEFAKNHEIGIRTGCWKSGVLVENDSGDVAKALAEWDAAH